MSEPLILVKIRELAAAYDPIHRQILADPDRLGISDAIWDMLIRWHAISVVISSGNEIKDYDKERAVKCMFLEMDSQFKTMQEGGNFDKILPQASLIRLQGEIDSILEYLKDVKII